MHNLKFSNMQMVLLLTVSCRYTVSGALEYCVMAASIIVNDEGIYTIGC